MKILHYSLGHPPYRTGGLTKYSIDLIKEQSKKGHDVSLLWPGEIHSYNKGPIIKKRKQKDNINSFEIINPLPVSLMGGIKDFDAFTKPCDKSIYYDFLKRESLDIIHLHTIMGLHLEFLQAAKKLGIKVVFTTHDYFGICPKVAFLYNNSICPEILNEAYKYAYCSDCNKDALSLKKVKILQSPIYRGLKNTSVIKLFRDKFKAKSSVKDLEKIENPVEVNKLDDVHIKEYENLRRYYLNMFNMVDKFHFNSENTKSIYERFINLKNYSVISITHKDIKNNIIKKEFKGKLKITYLGQASIYKGFFLLKDALDEIYAEGNKDFLLNMSSVPNNIESYMNIIGSYGYSDLKKIFENTDLLVVPSLCRETFGFVVLEALSYGVPVLISENLGSKDIVENKKSGFIIEMNKFELKNKILEVYNSRNILIDMNDYIIENYKPLSIDEHENQIMDFYMK